jgi:cell division protein FtsB
MQGLLVRIALGVFGLLTAATIVLAVFNDRGALQVYEKSQRLAAIESEIVAIEVENAHLAAEIQSLRTDPSAIEKLAREELKLVKPGEVVLVTPQP